METTDTLQLIKYALKLLSQRDHFRSEIISKLKAKKATSNQIEEVLEYLNKYNYINDLKTLRKFAEEISSSGRGINYFKKKLFEKGALEFFSKDVFSIETELDAARVFIKKLRTSDGDEILKKLISRGFSNEAVYLILKELKKGEVIENRSNF